MRIYDIKNIEEFFEAVDKCEGTVELVTSEGDNLNLKSNLCKYVSFAKFISAKREVPELEIVTHNPADMGILINYLVTEKVS